MNTSAKWLPRLTLMNVSRIEELHDAAVSILSSTGLNVHHAGMRQKLAAEGAQLGDGPRVFISPELVDRALRTAMRDVVICNRLGEPVMPLGPYQSYFGTGSDLIYTRDLDSGQRREAVIADVARAALLCDALDEIDFVMSCALPTDVDGDVEPVQYRAMVTNTVKPIIMTSYSGIGTLAAMHDLACTVAGGEQAFCERPNYILYGQFTSPLQHDEMAVERLVFCADHLVPLIYVPTIIPGASGPITLAGSLALAVAECLAGLVMHQLQRPGAPFIFGACVSQLDMRTMLFPYGSPEWRLNDLVMAELARHYGLPAFGTGGATDSKLVDAQAGGEYASSLLVAALAGTNLIHDVGYLDAGLMGSLESVVLAAEQIRWVKRFLSGIDASASALGLAAISEVGPAGHFLEHEHTLKHLRSTVWSPVALDRQKWDGWARGGHQDYAARARAYAAEVIAAHEPQPLDGPARTVLAEPAGPA